MSASAKRRSVGVSSKPWDFDASFEFGLSVIVAGLSAQRRE
jgi:hypothetical protein